MTEGSLLSRVLGEVSEMGPIHRARPVAHIPRNFLAGVIDIVKGTELCVDRQ